MNEYVESLWFDLCEFFGLDCIGRFELFLSKKYKEEFFFLKIKKMTKS